MRARLLWALCCLIVFVFPTFLISAPQPGQSLAQGIRDPNSMVLPAGFAVEEFASGLFLPVQMAFLPDGQTILVAEKGWGVDKDGVSNVRRVVAGVVQPEPVLTLSTNVSADSGILALVLDTQFDQNGHFYIWYATGQTAKDWQGYTVNRLSRFTYNSLEGKAIPGSEMILLDGIPWDTIHQGGGMAFGPDGSLYLAIGDIEDRPAVQDLSKWNGKLLRILPGESGYQVPESNPFTQTPGALPEIYAYGFRNPFRMVYRPADGHLYTLDVGFNHWEEVNRVTAAANYGWPLREGPCPIGQYQPCEPAPPHFTDPIVYYPHEVGQGAGVSALAFSDDLSWPLRYQGKLYFADYSTQLVYMADIDHPDRHEGPEVFAQTAGGIVDMHYRQGVLYVLDIYAGKINRIINTGNQPPVAVFTADLASGPPPLDVQFSAVGTTDLDDYVAAYTWDFGDGTASLTTTLPSANHTYLMDGTYTARLVALDSYGAASQPVELTITVYSGEFPQIVLTNLTEPGRASFYGGDEIQYTVQRTSGLAGLDPVTPFRWRVDLHHNEHAHPVIVDQATSQAIFEISTENHGDLNIWYRFYLTMRTDSGQDVTVWTEIFPAYTTLYLQAAPSDAWFTVNGVQMRTPITMQAIIGVEQTIEAAPTTLNGLNLAQFDHWIISDPIPRELPNTSPLLWFLAPVLPQVYTANYVDFMPANRVYLPIIAR